MANQLFALAAEKLLKGTLGDLSTAVMKIALVSTAYTENLAADEFYSQISSVVVGVDQTLTGVTVTGGKFKCNSPVWTAVPAGDVIECFVVYKWTGDPATSPLIARIDSVSGLPFATKGGDIDPTVDAANGLFKLVP